MPGFAANSVAELKLGANSGGGKILCLVLILANNSADGKGQTC
jgi:hypothetical protein